MNMSKVRQAWRKEHKQAMLRLRARGRDEAAADQIEELYTEPRPVLTDQRGKVYEEFEDMLSDYILKNFPAPDPYEIEETLAAVKKDQAEMAIARELASHLMWVTPAEEIFEPGTWNGMHVTDRP